MLSFSQTVLKIIFFCIAYISLALLPPDLFGAQPYEVGVILVDNLNVRATPGTQNPPVKELNKGEKVFILEHLNGWLKIQHDGQTGYIKNEKHYIRTIFVEENEEIDITGTDEGAMGRYKKEAEDIQLKIQKGTAKVKIFTKDESNILNSLNDIDLELDRARKYISAAKSELADLENQITQTTEASKTLTKRLETNQDYASKRLVSLYKLNWIGTINVLASAQSIYEILQLKKYMERILAHDDNIRQNLLANRTELQQMLERLNTQKMEKLSLEASLKKEMAIMSEERAKRQGLLADVRQKRTLEMAAIESLRQAANDLDQAIASLSSKPEPSEPAIKTMSKNFQALKGLLNMPVNGKIISFFGQYINDKFNVVNFRSGIEIRADRGEPIRAIFGGRIIYADWFKGYGNMIIIDHGNSYYSVYAHAEELFAAKGDMVEKGEVVATVGDTGSMIGPVLHFEVRHHGKPVDPLEWIKAG